ncbi:sigma-54 dependent transcriptional regulator [Candidatus Marinimicrobia bacterium]|jgi:DNA-binding NtrC family response regulator|nr:sigma-54 dependent transcriptional regulator [Candidatus Neomarinimicrobiota bacterium]
MNLDRLQKNSGVIGTSKKIKQVLEMVNQVSGVDISVLVTGESGTGKEVIAKAIHKNSKRSNTSFVIVNCGAIPEGIIESELFGHKKGSFTGANEDRKGYFEEANLGTIFLDEIGETPLETQVKLLRVLENGEFIRVGEAKTRKTDVRIIAATNKDLKSLVQKKEFREDLYYRLNTVNIKLPALRNRLEDIGPFIERFSLEFTRSNDLRFRGFMPDAIRTMKQYDWPGNIRELKHFVEKILVLERGERITSEMVHNSMDGIASNITNKEDLPVIIGNDSNKAEVDLMLRQLFLLKQDTEIIQKLLMSGTISTTHSENNISSMNPLEKNLQFPQKSMEIVEEGFRFIRDDAIGDISIKDLEKELITRTLSFFNNNRRKTARSLGLSERTLYRKIEEYGLEPKINRNK